MTILMRLDAQKQRMDRAEEAKFIAWLAGLGVEAKRVRAVAIEAPSSDGLDDHYLLHLAEHVHDPDGLVLHPATEEAMLTYRTLRLDRADWPIVRVHAER